MENNLAYTDEQAKAHLADEGEFKNMTPREKLLARAVSLEELKDEMIGKFGTPERNKYESELNFELMAETMNEVSANAKLNKSVLVINKDTHYCECYRIWGNEAQTWYGNRVYTRKPTSYFNKIKAKYPASDFQLITLKCFGIDE